MKSLEFRTSSMTTLQVENLSKSFGGIHAVKNCTIAIAEGKITALIGPNGAGKTTLFNLVNGFQVPDAGKIVFRGHEVTSRPVWERSRLGMSRTFQLSRLFKNLSIRENLILAMRTDDDELAKIFAKREAESEEQRAIEEMLRFVGLKKHPDTIVTDLSYGEQKLFDLARALLNPHTVLLLDEPVAGVNPVLREKLKEILKHLREKGETILLIEHDIDFVRSVADWVIVMEQGGVLCGGEPEKMLKDKRVLEAYLGSAHQ
jgi:ABC-type branched-subunit amino acid transport system ATPase component